MSAFGSSLAATTWTHHDTAEENYITAELDQSLHGRKQNKYINRGRERRGEREWERSTLNALGSMLHRSRPITALLSAWGLSLWRKLFSFGGFMVIHCCEFGTCLQNDLHGETLKKDIASVKLAARLCDFCTPITINRKYVYDYKYELFFYKPLNVFSGEQDV